MAKEALNFNGSVARPRLQSLPDKKRKEQKVSPPGLEPGPFRGLTQNGLGCEANVITDYTTVTALTCDVALF